MLFSQRKQLKPVRSIVQKDAMDDALRFALWDAFHSCIWQRTNTTYFSASEIYPLFLRYWHSYFNSPIDTLPSSFETSKQMIRKYFFECKWNEAYDIIEFTISNMPNELRLDFSALINIALKREMSAYRLIDQKIVEITAEEEIESIEQALNNSDKLDGVHAHLRTSISLLSNRENPDFRNSIKESISAIEALSQLITGDPKATLGTAMRRLESQSIIHPALQKSISALYGYASDADGIRHAMLEEPSLTYCDAKFILVSCTAFSNYLIVKATENGIDLIS